VIPHTCSTVARGKLGLPEVPLTAPLGRLPPSRRFDPRPAVLENPHLQPSLVGGGNRASQSRTTHTKRARAFRLNRRWPPARRATARSVQLRDLGRSLMPSWRPGSGEASSPSPSTVVGVTPGRTNGRTMCHAGSPPAGRASSEPTWTKDRPSKRRGAEHLHERTSTAWTRTSLTSSTACLSCGRIRTAALTSQPRP
jgi:hypothetical protein